jgi:hypothetical protein
MQWDPVWRLYKPLRGLFPLTAVEGPRHSHQRGVGGIVYARGTPSYTDCCGTARVTVLLGNRNPPRSWTGTVGPSLPGFTIALVWTPCCAIGLIRWPKSILQDSPEL